MSKPTLTGLLNQACPPGGNQLIGERARRRLQEVTDRLEADLSSRLGFEARLSPDLDQVDGHVPIVKEQAAVFLRFLRSSESPPAWNGLVEPVDRWVNAVGDPFHGKVQELWIGFDLNPDQPGDFPPRLFFSLPPGTGGFHIAAPEYAWFRNLVRHPARPDDKIDGEVPDWCSAERVTAAMPPGCRPILGFLPGRPQSGIKLCSAENDGSAARSFLQTLAVDIDTSAALAGLEEYAPHAGRVDVSVDVQDRIRPRIGLEIYPHALERPGFGDWEPIFQRLIDRGTADPGKIGILREFTSVSVQSLPGRLVPMIIFRRVSHIKLVCCGSRITQAKVYFILTTRPGGE